MGLKFTKQRNNHNATNHNATSYINASTSPSASPLPSTSPWTPSFESASILLSDKEKRFLLNCSCDTSLEWLRRQIYEGGVNINCQDRVSIPFNYYYFIHIYYCFIMINFCLFVYFVCIVH